MGRSVYFKTKTANITSDVPITLIQFEMPKIQSVRLIELSLFPDSAFMSYGQMKVVIGGQSFELDPQNMKSSFTIPLHTFNEELVINGRKIKGVVLHPGETVEIFGNSDGTNSANIDASLLGEVL